MPTARSTRLRRGGAASRVAWRRAAALAALIGSMVLSGCGDSRTTASRIASPAKAPWPGGRSLATGFVADPFLFGYPPRSVPAVWFQRMADLGAGWVRIGAYWNAIAPLTRPAQFAPADPGDPHYNWSYLDAAVRDATASDLRVVLTLGWAPRWALGPRPPRTAYAGTWRPDPAAFGAFARAVAERYSGHFSDPADGGRRLPRVRYFQAWNEPNLPQSLQPQWIRNGHGFVPASPAIYRRLLNALYVNVRRVQPDAYVLAAGLAPYGDPPGGDRVAPVLFLTNLLCVDRSQARTAGCQTPAYFDALDQHPYALTPTIHAFNPDDVSVPDLGRLARVLRAGVQSGHALPRRAKPIWVTEIEWDTSPPDPYGIPLTRQARYVSLAFYELWRQGASHVFWFEMRDAGFPDRQLTGSGLFFSNGRPKPSTIAFRFPFVAVPGASGTVSLWGRAPRRGVVTIERARGRAWQPLLALSTTPDGVFYSQRTVAARGVWRARIGSTTSYPWSNG